MAGSSLIFDYSYKRVEARMLFDICLDLVYSGVHPGNCAVSAANGKLPLGHDEKEKKLWPEHQSGASPEVASEQPAERLGVSLLVLRRRVEVGPLRLAVVAGLVKSDLGGALLAGQHLL